MKAIDTEMSKEQISAAKKGHTAIVESQPSVFESDYAIALAQAEISFKAGMEYCAEQNPEKWDNLQAMLDDAKLTGIKELGERLKQVREGSYDDKTFLSDLDELIDLALSGQILPQVVVKCTKTIYKNPDFDTGTSKFDMRE